MKEPVEIALKIGGQELNPPANIPHGTDALSRIINAGLGILTLAGILLAVFFIIWGGIRWSTSGGDKQKLESARKMIIFSIIGVVIIAFSFILLRTIGLLLNAPFLKSF